MIGWTKSCRLVATDHHARQLPIGLFVHFDVIVLDAASMREDEGRVGGGGVSLSIQRKPGPRPTFSFSFVLPSRPVAFYLPSHDMRATKSLRPISPQIESG